MSRFRPTTDRAPAAITVGSGEELRDQRRMQIAVAGSFVLHLALLTVALPRDPVAIPDHPLDPQIFRVREFRPRPPHPPPIEATPAPRPEARTVPVPAVQSEPLPEPAALLVTVNPPFDLPVWSPPAPAPAPAEPAARPIRFGHGMTRPVRIAGPDPIYTEPARRARITGVVVLEAVLDRDGRVREIEVLKSLPLGLTRSAVDAVSRWRFEPATLEGEPVAVIYNLTVRFELD